jgi:hypothetical protein
MWRDMLRIRPISKADMSRAAYSRHVKSLRVSATPRHLDLNFSIESGSVRHGASLNSWRKGHRRDGYLLVDLHAMRRATA